MDIYAACKLLNNASELDPCAMWALVCNNVPCNEGLTNHPTIPVQAILGPDDEILMAKVGMLSIINGIFNQEGKRMEYKWEDDVPGYFTVVSLKEGE